jgi:hypothetical protein
MDQCKLNADLFYEIFLHFVAVDHEGPFTLMLVCTAWQDMVLKHPPLWSWINIDNEIGDMEARLAICTTLSASQPLYLKLHLPFFPSLVQIIRPYVDRVRFVFVDCPMDMKIDTAVDHVSNLVHNLQLHHALFRFLKGGKYKPYCPASVNDILFQGQPLNSPTYPSNIITALNFSGPHNVGLHTLLTFLPSNIHLEHLVIDSDRLSFGTTRTRSLKFRVEELRTLANESSDPSGQNNHKEVIQELSSNLDEVINALPTVSLSSLRTLCMRRLKDISDDAEELEAIFLRHIQSPNPLAITLDGSFRSFVAAMCEIGAGLRPAAMTLLVRRKGSSPQDEKSEKIKRALSSVRNLHIHFLIRPMEMLQTNEILQWLPRSAFLRISGSPDGDQLASLVDHPAHLVHLDYVNKGLIDPSPEIPACYRNDQRFDSLALIGYGIFKIVPHCRKLYLLGAYSSQEFINSSSSLEIEELHCDSEIRKGTTWNLSEAGPLGNLLKITCTFSFALALLQRRRIPKLQELIFIGSLRSFSEDTSGRDQIELLDTFINLLAERRDTLASMRLISIPEWIPWECLFKFAIMLSEGNNVSSTPTLVIPSFPHPRLLRPLVAFLGGTLVEQIPDMPQWVPQRHYKNNRICYSCEHAGWICNTESWLFINVKHCRRSRTNEPVAITRYTLSN